MFTIAADISADTWLGASGWARGNQTCRGTIPAFEPNPARHSTKTSPAAAGDKLPAAARTATQVSPVAGAAITSIPIRTATNPEWVITAYQRPADATSTRCRCSTTTSSNDVNAISSQHARNVATLPAAGTSS